MSGQAVSDKTMRARERDVAPLADTSPALNRVREPLVSVREVAEYLSVTPAWVYEHADELGAIRLPSKSRPRKDDTMPKPTPRLRFSLSEVDERLSSCSASKRSEPAKPASQAASRPRRRQ